MEMLSVLLALCEDNSSQKGGLKFHRASYAHLDVFFVVNLTQLLDKESSCYCLERSSSDTILIINYHRLLCLAPFSTELITCVCHAS